MVSSENSKSSIITYHDVDLQVESMIEKNEGRWKCKVCRRTFTQKVHAQSHAETHIKGVSHACPICSKKIRTRHSLRKHMYINHSELLTCNVCGKTGMSRSAYREHEQRNHTVFSSKQ